MKFINFKFKTPYWIMWLSSVGNFAHTVDCLQYWLPTVFTNGTIGTIGINNGTIGRTLNVIACVHGSTNGTNGIPLSFKVLPMVPASVRAFLNTPLIFYLES